jgi:hypothetical protein
MAQSEEGFADMMKILLSLLSRPESHVFRTPVNWRELGLLDYPDIIKNPMDLGTVKKKMESGAYETVEV